MGALPAALVWLALWLLAASADASPPVRRIVIVGDSTASYYDATRYPRTGWGQVLERFLVARMPVLNRAVSGRSTRSYQDLGDFAAVVDELRADDLLLIQFGHNDEKRDDPARYTDPTGEFPRRLQRFVDAARAVGATPVLLTPVARRVFDAQGRASDSHAAYAQAVRDLALAQRVPWVDLSRRSMTWLDALGADASKAYYLHDGTIGLADDTHFHERGAVAVACLVISDLLHQSLITPAQLRADPDCDSAPELRGASERTLTDRVHAQAVAPATEVRTRAGVVRGAWRDGGYVYKGIRYGADTADTRFQAPLPVAAWNGVRPALDFGPPCPQALAPDASEDCLRLNVWTPSIGRAAARPVLVYLHGGGYSFGAVTGPVYDGGALSRRGNVVVVTLHHRVNGFGFLYLGDRDPRYRDSGNAGMLDLVLALSWVRDNIAAFGGDPDRVTLFGQSGGGAKCATLMAMPAARGLFHRVWTMSGQQLTGRTREHARMTAQEVLDRLGIDRAHLKDIEAVPLARLLDAMRGGVWAPVVDAGVLPGDPFEPVAAPQSRAIPMVLGNTLDETTTLIGPSDPSTFELNWEMLPDKLRQHISAFIGELGAEAIVAHYRRWYPQASARQVFFAASTAARSWKGMVLESERRATQGGPTWVYHLNWRTPLDGGRWGAPHMLDIPLLFDHVTASPYTNAAPAPAQQVADSMIAALLAFARTGDPNTPGLPRWRPFDLRHRYTLLFDLPPRLARDPRGRERRLFASIPYLQPGT